VSLESVAATACKLRSFALALPSSLLCSHRMGEGALSDPSVCLSHGAAALGYRHAGCLQLSHGGLRTHPRTDVDPPRVELPSAVGCIAARRAITCSNCSHRMCSRVYETVRLSVCPVIRPQQWRAAGLLLSAVRVGDIDRQRRAPATCSGGAAARR